MLQLSRVFDNFASFVVEEDGSSLLASLVEPLRNLYLKNLTLCELLNLMGRKYWS